ncbi:hypothetical protein AB1Y20_009778 [Prymnesium parvum]|uniref:Tubulin-folding cofactor E n=1 Tax=Prymnesium parvum TaxID=97485 RepID=A0AB34K6W4_PRYPA
MPSASRRRSTLRLSALMGRTFMEALRAKYEYTKGAEGVGELVGGEKTGRQQALATLSRVYLGEHQISDPGAEGEIGRVCSAIEELDLEANSLTSWGPIVAIISQLPRLHWLGLNRIPLEPLTAVPADFVEALRRLQTLCLSETGVSWDQLLLLAAEMPELAHLHFNGNALTTTAPRDGGSIPLAKLQTLWLEGNQLSDWSAVEPLSSLPHLQVLNLNYNLLAALPAAPQGFAALRHLMCRGNPLASWESIDALDRFPALCEARIAELPLTAAISGAVSRRVIIARVGKLTTLNGSEVRRREREDAERFYLRQVAQEYPEEGLPAGAFTEGPDGVALTVPEGEVWAALQKAHPRWRELLLKHGTHVTAGHGDGNARGVIANELLEITLRATAAEAASLPQCSRRLPGGLPLKSVKMIACQLFKVEPLKQQLLYSPPGQEKDIPELLDDDERSLCELGVVSGGTIIVEDMNG